MAAHATELRVRFKVLGVEQDDGVGRAAAAGPRRAHARRGPVVMILAAAEFEVGSDTRRSRSDAFKVIPLRLFQFGRDFWAELLRC